MAIGVTDFIAKRPDAGSACYSSITAGSSVDMIVRRLKSTIGDNVTCLVICLLIVVITGTVVWYVVSTLVASVSEWRRHQTPGLAPPSLDAPGSDDDVAYASKGGPFKDLPSSVNEASAVADRMKKVELKYGEYNRALARHAAKNGLEPDDVIDKRILARTDDDFRYGKEDDRLRFRKTRQEWVERERGGGHHGKGGTTPKYGS